MKLRELEERAVSSFGISIPTGIMLESLFQPTAQRYDISREVPNVVKIDNYKIHYFNIYTLARNIVSSVTMKNKDLLYTTAELGKVLISEINTIASLYQDSKCKPVLFVPIYDKLYKSINKNKDGEPKEVMLRDYVLGVLTTNVPTLAMGVHYNNSHKLDPTSDKVLITTHMTVDLLNIRRVTNLELLESHTGKLKKHKEWYSKYHPIGKLSLQVFPFIEELLYILGDKTFTLPMKLSIRRELHKLATEKSWTTYTGKMVILNDIKKNDILKDILKDYSNNY